MREWDPSSPRGTTLPDGIADALMCLNSVQFADPLLTATAP
jgi:hypothetical protein